MSENSEPAWLRLHKFTVAAERWLVALRAPKVALTIRLRLVARTAVLASFVVLPPIVALIFPLPGVLDPLRILIHGAAERRLRPRRLAAGREVERCLRVLERARSQAVRSAK